MAGNKKPRRPYRPKVASRGIAFDILNRAHVVDEVAKNFYVPLNAEDQRNVAIMFGTSIDMLMRGRGTVDHVRLLADLCNTSLVLAERKHGEECEADITAALDGLFRMQIRFKRTGKWVFDAIGLQAIRRAYDIHTAQVEIAGQGELIAAGNEVVRRAKAGHFYREAA